MFRILLCEDDPDVLKMMRRMLAAHEYDVVATGNGASALEEMYRPGRIDLLISDLVLPEPMSGDQLVTRARALDPGLPVIILTGYSHGFSSLDHLQDIVLMHKPAQRNELLTVIADLLPESPR